MSTQPVTLRALARPRLRRREFLQGTGILVGTLWASSTALIALAPSRAWALELKALDQPTGNALLVFTRQIFPHAKLDDAVYALVVKDLDAEAAGSADVKQLLTDGAAGLDKAAGGSFAAAPKEKQAEITASLAKTPFFEKVRGKSIGVALQQRARICALRVRGQCVREGRRLPAARIQRPQVAVLRHRPRPARLPLPADPSLLSFRRTS